MSKEKKESSLKKIVQKKIKKEFPLRKRKFSSWTVFWYTPSLKLTLLIFGIIIIFAIISRLKLSCFFMADGSKKYFQIINSGDNHFQNFIAIHAGIGMMIFALFIYIAESIKDKYQTILGAIYLEASYIYLLVVAEISTFFIFIWGDVNIIAMIPTIGIALLTINSIAKIIRLSINTSAFMKKLESSIINSFKRNIFKEIKEAIARNVFQKELQDRKILLNYEYFEADKENHFHFYSKQNGKITDINLNRLKEFADIVERQANDRGYLYYENMLKYDFPENINNNSISQTKEGTKLEINRNRYIEVIINDLVKNNKSLIAIDKKIIPNDDRLIKKLENLIGKIFKINKNVSDGYNKFDYSKNDFSHKFKELITYILGAIENKQEDELEVYLNIFEQVIVEFLEYNSSGDDKKGFTFEEARRAYNPWSTISVVLEKFAMIIDKISNISNSKIVDKILYFPRILALKAIEHRDHFIFQVFTHYYLDIYKLTNKIKNEEIKGLVIDRSWRYLQDLGKFSVGYEMEEESKKDVLNKEKISSFKDYLVYIDIVFQKLMKKAYDFRDIDSFREFKRAVLKIFRPRNAIIDYDIISIANEMKRTDNPNKKKTLKQKLDKTEFLFKIQKEIFNRLNQMFYGLGSWIIKKAKSETDFKKQKDILEFYDIIIKDENILRRYSRSVFSDINELTKLYGEVQKFEITDFWGWGHWEKHPEGEFYSPDSETNLRYFYIFTAIKIFSTNLNISTKSNINQFNNKFIYLVDKIIEDINKMIVDEYWLSILPDSYEEASKKLKMFLEGLKKEQQEKEQQIIRESSISIEKVKSYKDEVVKSFENKICVKNIFRHYKKFKNEKKYSDKVELSDFIRTIVDKAMFIEKWHTSYAGLGIWGQHAAIYENDMMLYKIKRNRKNKNLKIVKKDFEEILDNLKNINDFIIFAEGSDIQKFLDNSSFRYNYECNNPMEVDYFGGYFIYKNTEIPVFDVFLGDNQILLLNTKKMGEIIQYLPNRTDSEQEFVRENLLIKVDAFSDNEELLKELLDNPPDWLKKEGDRELQEKYLLTKVRILIQERIQYKPNKGESEIYYFEFPDKKA